MSSSLSAGHKATEKQAGRLRLAHVEDQPLRINAHLKTHGNTRTSLLKRSNPHFLALKTSPEVCSKHAIARPTGVEAFLRLRGIASIPRIDRSGQFAELADCKSDGGFAKIVRSSRLNSGGQMMNTDRTWLSFNSEHFEGGVRAVFSYVGNIVVATVIISAGAHVSGEVPSIALFGILRL